MPPRANRPQENATFGDRRSVVAVALALVALTALALFAFLPTLDQGWAPLDDELNFTRNPNYRGFSAEHLRWMWTTRLAGHYIPLSWMTLAADYQFSGMDPRGYHRSNVLLHLANGWLLFALAWRLLGTGSEASPGSSTRALAAFTAAAFFAVHPLRVESVAWITERRDMLCGFFCLLTLHAYLSAVRPGARTRWVAWGAALLAFAAALLSKGLAVALPAALLALDVVPLRRLPLDPRRWFRVPSRAVLLEKTPFVALAAACACAVFWAAGSAMVDRTQAPLEHRLLSAGYGLSFYLEKTVAPIAIPFQVPATHRLSMAANPDYLLRGLLFLTLLAATLAAWRRWPALALGLLVYTAFVLPVSGLLQAGPQLAAHRYTYLAIPSIALLLGVAVDGFARRLSGRSRIALGAVVLIASVALASAARRQVALWRDPVAFCSAAVRSAPHAPTPVGALARAHLQRGEPAEALAALRAGRARLPNELLLVYLEAIVLATSPDDRLRDGQLALPLALRAARATSHQDPAALFALAAAINETGDPDAASRLLDSAKALARAGRKSELLPALDAASGQLQSRGLVRWTTADWKRLPW